MANSFGLSRRSLLKAAAVGSAMTVPQWSVDAQTGEKTLTVSIPNSPATLDPINEIIHDPLVISESIFENLVEVDVDGNLRPQLAKALPELSADRLTHTFELREGVTFQNGQPLTSADVKYSFDTMLDPKRNAARRSVFTEIDKVTTDGPMRVHITTKEPYRQWLYFMTKYMGIWPDGSRDKLGDDYFKLRPAGIGTGPGIFETWRPNEYVSLKRNPNYWQKGLPHWDHLVVQFVPEDATRVAYLLTKRTAIIGAPPPRDFAQLKTRRGLAGGARSTLGGWSVMLMNSLKPPFDDVNFRKAVAYAINREELAKHAFFNMVTPATVPAPPGSWWYDEKADHIISYNPDKAREYLKKSKYPDGASFEMLLPSVPYLLDIKDAAVVIQSQLEKINIKPTLRTEEALIALGHSTRGEAQCLLVNIMSPGEPTYLIMVNFTPSRVMSKSSGWTSPELDSLLKQVYAESDEAKAKPLYARMMTLFAEQAPYVWLGFFDSTNLWNASVKDFKVNQGLTMRVRDTVPA